MGFHIDTLFNFILVLTLSHQVSHVRAGPLNNSEAHGPCNNDSKDPCETPSLEADDKPFLLPTNVRPTFYRLEIIPLLFPVEEESSLYSNASRFSAPGKVWITVTCFGKSNNITLHAHDDIDIKVDRIQVVHLLNSSPVSVTNVTRDKDTDFLVLHLDEDVGSGSETDFEEYSIYIEFVSRVADDRLNGLYLDYYVNPVSKEKRYLSTTLFAPNHARKAFPCFDEPGFKAPFEISIGRKSGTGYYSISNMPVAKTEPIAGLSGWVMDVFEPTIKLPTYLVAMITTDFASRSLHSEGVEIKLHAPAFLLEKTKKIDHNPSEMELHSPFILQDPLLVIESMLQHFQPLIELAPFPQSKLDIIALPHFFFSAMENMGAMTFKYPVILNIENTTTVSELLRIASVAGHEVTHNWFGNMLTPKSWTYVWLKESFSDMFSRHFLAQLMHIDDFEDLVNSELQVAMRFDESVDTHPMENVVKSVASVGEIYTRIPYTKGASIMHMTWNFLSKGVFQDGLKSLFKSKKFSNIDQNDLFDALERSQRKKGILASQGLESVTVTDILNTWTKQSGYPVVRISRENSTLTFRQEKIVNGIVADLTTENSTTTNTPVAPHDGLLESDGYWWIPLFIRDPTNSSGRKFSVQWMRPDNETTKIDTLVHSSSNIHRNAGYYRVLYSKDELHSVLKGIARLYHSEEHYLSAYRQVPRNILPNQLLPVERSQLVDDYFAFAFSKYKEVPVNLLFHILTTILPFEREYVVWNTVLANIKKPFQLLQNTQYYEPLQEYMAHVLNPLYNFLESQVPTVTSTSCSSHKLVRKLKLTQFHALVLSWLCEFHPEECRSKARKTVLKFMANEQVSSVPADVQNTLYCNAMRTASSEDLNSFWTFFERKYFEEYYSVQRDRYLKALSCVSKREYLQRLLSWTMRQDLDFHDIDRVELLKNVIANPVGRDLIFSFLDDNFESLYKINSVANPVTEAVKGMVEYCNSQEKLNEMESFISHHSEAMEKKKKFLEKQVKNAKLNILWVTAFAKDIQTSASLHIEDAFAPKTQCERESEEDFDGYIHRVTSWA